MAGEEELCRELDRAKKLLAEYDVPMRSAIFTDTPGCGWGLAEVLTQAGIEYLVCGMNESLSEVLVRSWIGLVFLPGEAGTAKQ